jgi:hypothetical protein
MRFDFQGFFGYAWGGARPARRPSNVKVIKSHAVSTNQAGALEHAPLILHKFRFAPKPAPQAAE